VRIPEDRPDRLHAARELAGRETGLAVVVTYRADGSAHTSVVNAGVVDHPISGEQVVGFVVQGRARTKLANLRRQPLATVVFRSGWDWVAIEGGVELLGPDDEGCVPWPEAAAVFHSIYAEAIGGSVEDWASGDPVIERDGHAAVLVRPAKVYGGARPL
jgi:Pyridoxamine 5'-phosphate oxidase